jgi:CRP/FNR family transcriptional regulator
MPVVDYLTVIRNNDFFSEISEEDFNSMNIIHHFKETPKGDFIYFEAHLHNSLYFLKDGFVKIGFYNENGEEVIKDIIGKGDVFGQFTLLPKNMEGEFAQAHKGDVSLCMFKVDAFEQLLRQNPQITLKFTKQLGEKMLKVENRMLNLLHKTVAERLQYFLLNLTRQFPDNLMGERFLMDTIFTHDDIARLIGSSRQTVSTLINQWEKQGVICFTRHSFIIPEVNKLQKILSVG